MFVLAPFTKKLPLFQMCALGVVKGAKEFQPPRLWHFVGIANFLSDLFHHRLDGRALFLTLLWRDVSLESVSWYLKERATHSRIY